MKIDGNIEATNRPDSHKTVSHTASPRLLRVYEVVVMNGPIELDSVYKTVGISRSASFRSLKKLEESGWIRMLLNNHQYVATSHVDELISNSDISLPEIDLVCDLLRQTISEHKMNIDVGIFITQSAFYLVESSDKGVDLNQRVEASDSYFGFIAHFLNAQQSKSLVGVKNNHDLISLWPNIDLSLLNSIDALLGEWEKDNFLLSNYEFSATIGLIFKNNIIGAINISPKYFNRDTIGRIKNCCYEVIDILEQEGILGKYNEHLIGIKNSI